MAFAASTFTGVPLSTHTSKCVRRAPQRSRSLPSARLLSERVVTESPAIARRAPKYIFPMRDSNTQVFFDNSLHDEQTLMIIFAEDRHGLVLDVVSVLKGLGVCVKRTASSESEALRVMFHRIEGELISLSGLHLAMENCIAFWVHDVETGEKIFDDGERLEQLTARIKDELQNSYPRPVPARIDHWHRVSVQKNRKDRYTVFSIQTSDRPGLLAAISRAFTESKIDIASATITTNAERVENTFFVTKSGFKEPLVQQDIDDALEGVMRALLAVGEPGDKETLWYQVRDGADMLISEAIFIDEVNNTELAAFAKLDTPNFRGRLPDAPYRPVSLQ